ncbi:hypothetical protein A2U01_0115300, partial [Trifolium medium]|nr:hypothetical protein [Trifolium medium]
MQGVTVHEWDSSFESQLFVADQGLDFLGGGLYLLLLTVHGLSQIPPCF